MTDYASSTCGLRSAAKGGAAPSGLPSLGGALPPSATPPEGLRDAAPGAARRMAPEPWRRRRNCPKAGLVLWPDAVERRRTWAGVALTGDPRSLAFGLVLGLKSPLPAAVKPVGRAFSEGRGQGQARRPQPERSEGPGEDLGEAAPLTPAAASTGLTLGGKGLLFPLLPEVNAAVAGCGAGPHGVAFDFSGFGRVSDPSFSRPGGLLL